MELIGKVTERLNIKSELDDKAMGRMKERTEQAERERSGRTAILLDQEPSKSRPRATTRTVWPVKSQNTPTSHTKAQSKVTRAKNTSEILPRPPKVGLRRRVLHSLALEPLHFDKIVQRLVPLSHDKLKSVLNEVAIDNGSNIWTLQNACYREINIADWRNYTSTQRLAVMFNARDAFDALKLPADASERAQLAEIKGQQRKQVIPRNSHSGSSASSPDSDDAPPKPVAGTILKTDSEKASKRKNPSAVSHSKAKGGHDSDSTAPKAATSNESLKRKATEQKQAPAIQKRPREEVSSASRLPPSKQQSSISINAKRKAAEVDDRRTYKRRATGSSSSGTPSPPLSDSRRIPNSGGGSERSVSSNSSQSSDVAARNRPMKVPRITAREDYIRYRGVFEKKHSEYIGLLEKCNKALTKTNGRSSEKHAPEPGDLRKWTERYKVLHEELGLLKGELWRASREEHVL